MNAQTVQQPTEESLEVKGYFELVPTTKGGYIRVGATPTTAMRANFERDVYVGPGQILKFALQTGNYIVGQARPPKRNEKSWGLMSVATVDGKPAEERAELAQARRIYAFTDQDQNVPVFPDRQIVLSTEPNFLATRYLDLLVPQALGQRTLTVSGPRSGKTTLLKQILHGVTANNPDVWAMLFLTGERPEEVTDFRRTVNAEIVASTGDDDDDVIVEVAQNGMEAAKCRALAGQHVFVAFDSITRYVRALNMILPGSGKTLSGGLDPQALTRARKFFMSARRFENGGSLTIVATCLHQTDSTLDDNVFMEFKGTGNSEIYLDSALADLKQFPTLMLLKSSTRNEHLVFTPGQEAQFGLLWKLVMSFKQMAEADAGKKNVRNTNAFVNQMVNQLFFDLLKRFPTNAAFMDEVNRLFKNASNGPKS